MAKSTYSNTRAVVYCILSLAVSALCIYQLIDSRGIEPSMQLHITDNAVINNIIETAVKFAEYSPFPENLLFGEYLHSFMFLGVGITSLLFFLLFSDCMNAFFSQLPLGSIRKFDFFEKHKKGRTILLLSPSLIIGLYTSIHSILYHFSPEKIDFLIKWILPAAIILVSIACLTLIISIMLDGGLWGIITRVPLMFTTNLYFSILMGSLMMFGIFAIILLLVNSFIIITSIIAVILLPKTTTKTEYEVFYR